MKQITVAGSTLDVQTVIERYKEMKQSARLTERRAAIFEDKFGVNDGVEKTYAAVGIKFGISNERVRQLCARVLHEIGL
jgi:DNA-directed RNA polymerase sigma subunit (sigma70/sigma32)